MKKSTILIAILLLSVFLIPTTMAFQQLAKSPNISSATSRIDFKYVPYGDIFQPCGPGSGGGGEGTI